MSLDVDFTVKHRMFVHLRKKSTKFTKIYVVFG